MVDYTPEGVRYNQGEIAVSHLYLINKQLRKINRRLSIACLAGVVFISVKHKDSIKEFINKMKGE